jgi:hypothetical protein
LIEIPEREQSFRRRRNRNENNTVLSSRNRTWQYAHGSSNSGWGPEAGYCEDDYGGLSSRKSGKSAEQPSVSKEGLRSIILGEKLLTTVGRYLPS